MWDAFSGLDRFFFQFGVDRSERYREKGNLAVLFRLRRVFWWGKTRRVFARDPSLPSPSILFRGHSPVSASTKERGSCFVVLLAT